MFAVRGVLGGCTPRRLNASPRFDSLVITTAVTGTSVAGAAAPGLRSRHANLAGNGLPPLPLITWVERRHYLGVIASGMAYPLHNASLRHLDASEVGVYTNLIPSSARTGVTVLGEPLDTRHHRRCRS